MAGDSMWPTSFPTTSWPKSKKAVLAEKPDALLLGEVWEDASNKISYGHLRRYLQGSELDSAMDYPSATWSSAF